MKKNNKHAPKRLVATGLFLCLLVSVIGGLVFYTHETFNNQSNVANAISAAQSLLQRYSIHGNLDGVPADEQQEIRNEIAEALNDLITESATIDRQIRDIDPKYQAVLTQIKAIDAEAAVIGKDLAPKNASVKVFIDAASVAERNYIQKNTACNLMPVRTAAEKKAKATCATAATALKAKLDAAIVALNGAKNKLPALEAQKVSVDKQYADKMAACNKLPTRNAKEKGAKTKCLTEAATIKKTVDGLVMQIENEKKYVAIELQVKQKQAEKEPLMQQAMDLLRAQNDLRNLKDQVQVIRDQLTALQESFKEPELVRGCTDPSATNPNPNATVDDGSCQYLKQGCTDSAAANYESDAVVDDGSCQPKTPVCTTEGALNKDNDFDWYNEIADETKCEFPELEVDIDDNTGDTPEQTACTCPSGAPLGNTNEQVYRMNAYITHFGGPTDYDVDPDETGSVSGENLRSLKTDTDKYIAWPMPDAEKANGFLDTARCYGPETDSWPGPADERVAKANQALNKQYVEVSYTNPSGVKTTTKARIVDRGPRNGGRIDASKATWYALGLKDVLDLGPDPSKGQQVPLEIKLIPKVEGPGGCPQ